MAIRVLLADDHEILRDGLSALLGRDKDIHVVGAASNGLEACELAKSLNPDVIVMDVSMPILNGIEATQKIMSEMPDMKIIALTMHREKFYVNGIKASGAKGYLLKDCAFDQLRNAIHTIANGDEYFENSLAVKV
ncbi:MAG: hypothetical protein A2Y07_00815 [Planctomycetes bacterium GWF2_50_10]|nr:MAG: hypothetical protein A2Y07_00815 [Planctomycetes bacterium GWF2_50_10]